MAYFATHDFTNGRKSGSIITNQAMLYHGNLHPKSFHSFVRMWTPCRNIAVIPSHRSLDRLALAIASACMLGLAIGLTLS